VVLDATNGEDACGQPTERGADDGCFVVRTRRLVTQQYEPGSAPALALEASIARTETRFAKYANDGLLCGSDGLPHLISDPGLALRFNHAGDVWVSSAFVTANVGIEHGELMMGGL